MILEKGNMWSVYDQSSLFLFTANSSLNSKGELIMGAGIAKEAKHRLPDLPYFLGREVLWTCGQYGKYGLIISPYKKLIGIFQTKTNWKEPSTLELIIRSTAKLLEYLDKQRTTWEKLEQDFSTFRVDLNFPGIGLGGLSKEEVLPIISVLPNNVHIWEKE